MRTETVKLVGGPLSGQLRDLPPCSLGYCEAHIHPWDGYRRGSRWVEGGGGYGQGHCWRDVRYRRRGVFLRGQMRRDLMFYVY